MLENVDRLLKSPADQRGRDFAVMLTSLNKLDMLLNGVLLMPLIMDLSKNVVEYSS